MNDEKFKPRTDDRRVMFALVVVFIAAIIIAPSLEGVDLSGILAPLVVFGGFAAVALGIAFRA